MENIGAIFGRIVSLEHIIPFLGVLLHAIDKTIDRVGWLGHGFIPNRMKTDYRKYVSDIGQNAEQYIVIKTYFDFEKKLHLIIVSAIFSQLSLYFSFISCATYGQMKGGLVVAMLFGTIFVLSPVFIVFRNIINTNISPSRHDGSPPSSDGDDNSFASRWLHKIWQPNSLSYWSRVVFIQLIIALIFDIVSHKICK